MNITMSSAATSSTHHRQIPIVCPGHTRPLAEVQFCAIQNEDESRTFLLSACHDKMPMMRCGITGNWIGTFKGHKGAVWSCRLDPAGYLAATASGDFSVKVWDAITGQDLKTFPHKHIVKTVEFSGDSKWLATGGHEGILRIFDLQNMDKEPIMVKQLENEKVNITKCLWLDESTVMAGASDGKIRFWQNATTSPVLSQTVTVDSSIRDVELVTLSGNKRILVVAAGKKVSFFDLNDPKNKLLKCYNMPIHFREEGGASLHPSGTKFVAGGSDLWVRVFDYESGEELECLKGHHGPIRCLRYSPDGKTFATGSEDGTIRIWKTDPQQL